ncbi:YrbL family protein [Legionella tunisiensis]|uniref:YrbL family protein n=1 Tax=Legionella tunisiensis TaxID=1034944 RepID=UPI00031514E3
MFDEQLTIELHQFFKQIYKSPIIIGDLNRRNIVYSYNKGQERGRFVLIDGFGDKTFFLTLVSFLF